jgi:bacterioferritin
MICRPVNCAGADAASKQLFEKLINDEEGHFDDFEKQLENIKRFGPNYLPLESFGGNGMKAEAAR